MKLLDHDITIRAWAYILWAVMVTPFLAPIIRSAMSNGWIPKDRDGWPIEHWGADKTKSIHRIICQKLRHNWLNDSQDLI